MMKLTTLLGLLVGTSAVDLLDRQAGTAQNAMHSEPLEELPSGSAYEPTTYGLPDDSPAGCTATHLSSTLQTFMVAGVDLSVETALTVPEGGSFGEGEHNLATAFNATALPEVCVVIVRVRNSTAQPPSDFRFGLMLPPPRAWNGRFLAVGNGAFLGGINWPAMGSGPHYGFATMSTDTGHSSGPGDLAWALDQPGRLLDWGYRAVRGSVVVAKHILTVHYGAAPARSYFTGCSTGGRQGLKAVQEDPDSFDGALIGAPAWDTKHLMPAITRAAKSNTRADGSLVFNATDTAANGAWHTLTLQVILQCDGADGVLDGIVSSPDLCRLDFDRFTCPPGLPQLPGCLTLEQVAVVRAMYTDYILGADGSLVLNGMELGSESDVAGWTTFLNNPVNFAAAYERFFLYNDTSWNISEYSDQVVLDARSFRPGRASADRFDLTPFRTRGGKLLLYHGVADGLVPTRSSTHYYERARDAAGGQDVADAFLRHFLVPGMGHCWFSPPWVNAPWMFGGAGQAAALQMLPPASTPKPPPEEFTRGWGTPLFRGQVDYDALLLLMRWVENGTAPDVIKAVAYGPDWQVARTRKLCSYPRRAELVHVAKVDDEAAWECR